MPEVNISRGPLDYQLLSVPETDQFDTEPENGWWANLGDTFGVESWFMQVPAATEQLLIRNSTREIGFDALANVPKGYDIYADDFAYAESPEEIEYITSRIDRQNESRERLAGRGTANSLLQSLLVGVLDPVNLVGGPALRGAGFIRGLAEGGAKIGSVNAATEVVRHNLDPTSTIGETAINIGFGYAIAGLIGGGIGHFSKAPIEGVGRLSDEARVAAEKSGENFTRALREVDGTAVAKRMDFEGQGVKIVDGPTGKFDKNGNPVKAFFRSREVHEQLARRGDVSKAADDALGDVIPDGPRVVDDILPDDEVASFSRQDFEEAGEASIGEATVRGADEAAEDAASPFSGEKAADDATATKGEKEEFEDTIYIDAESIAADFPNKPWTSPRYEGIDPLAPDAFQTAEEWVNFVALHELNHVKVKKIEGESIADYENRINRLAYEEIQAGKLPISPTDNFVEKVMLRPTPQGNLMAMAPREVEIHQLAQEIAGDNATLMLANKAGQPTVPGGSVFQKSLQWTKQYFRATTAARASYVQYIYGKTPQSLPSTAVDMAKASVPLVGGAARQKKLKPKQWREYIGRAVFDDEPFTMHDTPLSDADMALVREASAEVRKSLDAFEDAARNLGLFDQAAKIKKEISWREKANARDAELIKKDPRLKELLDEKIAARKAELDDLNGTFKDLTDNPIPNVLKERYFPRIYNIGVVRDRYDDFTALIADGFKREGERLGMDPEAPSALLKRAEKVADRIIGEGVEENTFGLGGPKALKSRQIPLSNKELADFIVTDVDMVVGIYTRRMAPVIEMVQRFGSKNLDEQFDEMQSTLIAKKYSKKQRDNITWEMEALRDRVLNNFSGKNPLSWSNRTARALKNMASLQVMGRGIYAQTVDVARTMGAEGYEPAMKAFMSALDGDIKQMFKGKVGREAGEGFEMAMSRMLAQTIDDSSSIMVTNQSGIERGLAAMQAPFFNANLMNPFTVAWKDFTSIMSGHRLIRDSRALGEAFRSGKTRATLSKSEAKIMSELASWGIDHRTAMMIADQPYEKTEQGLFLANIEAWSGKEGDKAREALLGAMSGNLRSNVVTPGPLQRAAIMDGVFRWKGKRVEMPLLSLPFQLMSFSLSASAKVTHALISGRDRNRFVTLTSLMVGGYVSAWMAAGDGWEYMDWKEKMYAMIDRSGAFGYLMDPVKRVEQLTGYGPQKAMGLRPFGEDTWSDNVGAVAGPALSVQTGLIEAMTGDNLEDMRRASLARKWVPWSGLMVWDEYMKDLSSFLAKGGLVDIAQEEVEFDEDEAVAGPLPDDI